MFVGLCQPSHLGMLLSGFHGACYTGKHSCLCVCASLTSRRRRYLGPTPLVVTTICQCANTGLRTVSGGGGGGGGGGGEGGGLRRRGSFSGVR